MITKKALKAKLQAMEVSTVLFPSWKRTTNNRGYAVEQGLKSLVGENVTFGHRTHCSGRGNLKANPKWFTQLYTELMWSGQDITPSLVLMHLN